MKSLVAISGLVSLAAAAPGYVPRPPLMDSGAARPLPVPGPMENLNPIYNVEWNETRHEELHKEQLGHAGLLARDTDAPFKIKKGLAYNNAGVINVLSRSGSATWAYNWGAALDCPKFQGIPMWWGPNGDGQRDAIHQKMDRGDTPWVLGYNEPDVTRVYGGCQKTPREAYDAWGNNMFQFHDRGAKLVCPAISSWDTLTGHTGGPSGFTWLRQFASIGNNPAQFRCGAQALHWYGEDGKTGAAQGQLFIDYMNRARGIVNDIFKTDMPIWVTEVSPLPLHNPTVMADFLRKVIPYLNQQVWIHRFAPHMAEDMIQNGNALNVAGEAFVNTV